MNANDIYYRIPPRIRYKVKALGMKLYAYKMKRFYAQFVSPQDLVFDIGANDGDYAQVFADLGARVVLVEPQKFCVEKLKARFKNNKRVCIIEAGVGNKSGFKEFFVSTNNNPVSTFSKDFMEKSRYKTIIKWDKKVKVKMVTLQELIKKYGVPKFCKIDVEGYELEVLSTLKTKIPYLSFEMMTESVGNLKNIVRILERIGIPKFKLSGFLAFNMNQSSWMNSSQLINWFENLTESEWTGDVYVKY